MIIVTLPKKMATNESHDFDTGRCCGLCPSIEREGRALPQHEKIEVAQYGSRRIEQRQLQRGTERVDPGNFRGGYVRG